MSAESVPERACVYIRIVFGDGKATLLSAKSALQQYPSVATIAIQSANSQRRIWQKKAIPSPVSTPKATEQQPLRSLGPPPTINTLSTCEPPSPTNNVFGWPTPKPLPSEPSDFFLKILLSLDNTLPIPRMMLDQATQPRQYFDGAGNLVTSNAPYLGEVFQTTDSLERCVEILRSEHKIKVDSEYVRVEPHVPFGGREISAQLCASKIVFHAFPAGYNASLPNVFVGLARPRFPHLQHIVQKYYNQRDDILSSLQPAEAASAVQACISGSWFGDIKWKTDALSVAARILPRANSPYLAVALNMRNRHLSYIYSDYVALSCSVEAWTQCQQGEILLLEAQKLMNMGKIQEAMSELQSWPFARASTTMDAIISQKVTLKKCKALRLLGKFHFAEQSLQILRNSSPPLPEEVNIPLISELMYTLCENGKFDKAKQMLLDDYEPLSGIAMLLTLTKAWLYLSEGIYMDGRDPKASILAVGEAQRIFNNLESSYRNPIQDLSRNKITLLRQFSIAAGLAITTHLQYCALPASVRATRLKSCWEACSRLATTMRNAWGWDYGFLDALIEYSQYDAAIMFGDHISAQSHLLAGQAPPQEPQFYWFALSTYWNRWLLERRKLQA